MIYMEQEINKMISSFQQLPYLFVGTGISMRYANAPSWEALLYSTWLLLNVDQSENDYKRLKQGIELELKNSMGDIDENDKKHYINPILASRIQTQFDDLYFNDSDFHTKVFSEEEDTTILDNKFDPFKFYIAKEINSISLDITKPDYPEIEHLIKNQNKFAGIITTNYDSIIESIFSDFSVMIGQDNLLLSNSFNIFEIFKIHGCTSKPNSIILTDEDYTKFKNKLKYLSAKLLTIFVEHPIIFIGYGMADVNIIALFSEIAKCLTNEQLNKIKDNLIFITPAFNGQESIGTIEIVFEKSHLIMKQIVLKDYSILYKSLDNM